MWILTHLACVGAGPSLDTPALAADGGPPIDEWLPGTTWNCQAISSLGATRYSVRHQWVFTDKTFSTSLGTRAAAEANSGYLPQFVAQEFQGWIQQDGDGWSNIVDETDRHWFGVTDTTLLLEITASQTNDGTPTRHRIERYEDTDGSTGAEISMPCCNPGFVIDCVQVE